MSFTVNVVGLKELQEKLRNAQQAIVTEVGGELKAGADTMVGVAKTNAPEDQGILRNLISSKAIDKLHYEVSSGAAYSPFLEFGTRAKVVIPPGLEEYAAQFKGDFASGTLGEGSELTAWEGIKAWLERQGVEEQLWWAIYVEIMVHGIEPRPFFFPALDEVTPQIIENVKTVLADVI